MRRFGQKTRSLSGDRDHDSTMQRHQSLFGTELFLEELDSSMLEPDQSILLTGEWSLQKEIAALQVKNLNLQREKAEVRTEIAEIKTKNDLMEHEAFQNRTLFQKELQRVEE